MVVEDAVRKRGLFVVVDARDVPVGDGGAAMMPAGISFGSRDGTDHGL